MNRLIIFSAFILIACNAVEPTQKQDKTVTMEEEVSNKWDPPKDLTGYRIDTKGAFVSRQKEYPRVRRAYQKKGPIWHGYLSRKDLLAQKGLNFISRHLRRKTFSWYGPSKNQIRSIRF